MIDALGNKVEVGDRVALSFQYGMRFGVMIEEINWNTPCALIQFEDTGGKLSANPESILKIASFEWPDKCHESHKSVRSSDASTFDFICDDCGSTDDVTGGWGSLRKPCKGSRK